MGKREDGGSAFPVQTYLNPENGSMEWGTGMTLRQWYKGMAMQGWIAALGMRQGQPGYSDAAASEEAARLSAHSADALIADDKEAAGEA